MNKDGFAKALALAFLICGILVGLFLGAAMQDADAYKRGQLDYQAGKIEWTMIDGKLHHIQEGK